MQIVRLLLDHHAKFHFGDAAGNLRTHFSSDQLFSALMNNIVLMYGPESKELGNFIEILKENKFHFSSLFFGLDFYSKQTGSIKTTLYFLPKPHIELNDHHDKNISSKKMIKKMAYVSLRLYQKLSSNWNRLNDTANLDFDSIVVMNSKFAVLRDELTVLGIDEADIEYLQFLQVNTIPGVEVGRLDVRSENFFYQEELELTYDQTANYVIKPFMYFFYQGELFPEIKAAINLLKDEGIGGKRSRGKGFFKEIEFVKDFNSINQKGLYYMNLSTLFPSKTEVFHLLNYELEKRNGFIYSLGRKQMRKKSLMVVSEGSLLKEKVRGEFIEVQPKGYNDHKIYLYGKPLLIGFGGAQNE